MKQFASDYVAVRSLLSLPHSSKIIVTIIIMGHLWRSPQPVN